MPSCDPTLSIFFLLLVDFSILLFLCRRTICRSLLEAPSGGCRERQEDWQNQKLADPIAKLIFRNIGHAFYRAAENPLSFALRMMRYFGMRDGDLMVSGSRESQRRSKLSKRIQGEVWMKLTNVIESITQMLDIAENSIWSS